MKQEKTVSVRPYMRAMPKKKSEKDDTLFLLFILCGFLFFLTQHNTLWMIYFLCIALLIFLFSLFVRKFKK